MCLRISDEVCLGRLIPGRHWLFTLIRRLRKNISWQPKNVPQSAVNVTRKAPNVSWQRIVSTQQMTVTSSPCYSPPTLRNSAAERRREGSQG